MAISLSFAVGIIGNVISLLVFTSPIKTFRQVVKKKSTENYKGDPYITTLLSTSLWTFYGLLKRADGLLIVTVNGSGVVLHSIYVILFLVYASHAKKVKMAKLVGILNVGFVGAVIGLTLLAIHKPSIRLTFVGIVCAALTIAMYAAPLSAMRTVIVSKSVKYMPFLLSFFLFLNAGTWSIYSLLVKDLYIGVPNAIGFVLGLTQLIMYWMYYKSKSTTKGITEEDDEEMGCGHLVDDDDEEMMISIGNINKSLNKGKSLPKPSVMRQQSLQKLMKTLSLSSFELHSPVPVKNIQDIDRKVLILHQEPNL